jgi:cell fate (sporulation/competence/biofilm development) regulator YlbF (YheA/YmcA/DUF963 family)
MLQYIGQTGCSFKPRFNEPVQTIKYNRDTSTYAQHTVNTGHTYGNMQDTMEIIQVARKGRHMNNIEKCHMFCAQNKQMNEVLFDLSNSIFEAVYNRYITQ